MPRDVLPANDRIAALGVRITCGTGSRDSPPSAEGGFDASSSRVGAHLSKRVEHPARTRGGSSTRLSFLRRRRLPASGR
jgi:hypothetical protein